MKKLLSLLICALLSLSALSFVACGDGDYPTEAGATELMFYAQDFEDWSNEHLYNLVREFNSNLEDGIQVRMVMYEDADYTNAIQAARDGGYAPDIYMVSYGNLAGDIKRGYPAPLNDLMPQAALDDILDYVKEMVCYDGVYYGYPQQTEPSSLLFYRKDMFETAGITSDPAEWDWNDLIAACAQIKPTLERNRYVIGLPTGLPLAWSTVGLQYNTAGYLPINDNWDTCTISSTISTPTEGYKSENPYANMARLWWDLNVNGYAPAGQVSPTGYNDIIQALCDGRLAMTFAGSWSVAEIFNTYPDVAPNIGVAPVPTITGSKDGPTATNGGWVYAVSNSSSAEKKQMAADFIHWLLAEDTARTASYFEVSHYSKAAATKSVQAYIEQNTTGIDPQYQSWLDVINDVAAKAISEPLYSFDISLRYSEVLEWTAVNADPNSTPNIDSLLSQRLSECIGKITNDIEINELAGTNPKKEA